MLEQFKSSTELLVEDTVELYEEIQKRVPESVFNKIFQPNILLTIGGVRIQTEFFINESDFGDIDNYRVTKSFLEEKGVILTIDDEVLFNTSNPTRGKFMMFNVQNIKSCHRFVEQYHTLGLSPRIVNLFDTVETEIEFSEVQRQYALELGNKFNPESLVDELYIGSMKGYPPTAIFDFYDAVEKDNLADLVSLDEVFEVSSAIKKRCKSSAVPWFDFYPDHIHTKDIQDVANLWIPFMDSVYSKFA